MSSILFESLTVSLFFYHKQNPALSDVAYSALLDSVVDRFTTVCFIFVLNVHT